MKRAREFSEQAATAESFLAGYNPGGGWSGLIKPILKAIPRVVAHTAASMVQMPVSGIAAGAKLISSGGGLNAANQVLQDNQAALDEFYLTTPEELQGAKNIGLAMKPFQMAGEGWGGLAELAFTPPGSLQKAADVVEGRSPGSTILVPLAKTGGEAAAMFGPCGAGKAGKARLAEAFKPLENVIPEAPPETILRKAEPSYTTGEINPDLIVENRPCADRFLAEETVLPEAKPAAEYFLLKPEVQDEYIGTGKTTGDAESLGIRRYKDRDVDGHISRDSAEKIRQLGFDTKESDAVIPQKSIDYINKSHGGQLTSEDIDYISKTINEPTEILPNVATAEAPHRGNSVLMVRSNGKDYVSIIEITKENQDNILWNFWKMEKKRADKYLEKFRQEKARIIQSGGRTAPHIPHNTPEGEVGKPEVLSGSQTENPSLANNIAPENDSVNTNPRTVTNILKDERGSFSLRFKDDARDSLKQNIPRNTPAGKVNAMFENTEAKRAARKTAGCKGIKDVTVRWRRLSSRPFAFPVPSDARA